MKRGELFRGAAVVATAIGVAIVVVKLGLGKIQHIFDGLDPQAGIILGVSAVVLLLCSALIATAIRAACRRENELWRQTERTRIYQALLETLANCAADVTGTGSPLIRSLFLIGSAPVLREYQTLVQMLFARNAGEQRLRKQVNRLMIAMRRDVGGSTLGLEHEDWSAWLQNPVGDKSRPESNSAAPTQPAGFDFAEPAHRLSSRA